MLLTYGRDMSTNKMKEKKTKIKYTYISKFEVTFFYQFLFIWFLLLDGIYYIQRSFYILTLVFWYQYISSVHKFRRIFLLP